MSKPVPGWSKATIADVADYVQRGKSPRYTKISALPVVNQKCIRWQGIEEQHLKYVDPTQWDAWGEERFLQHGDILWNSTGTGTIGRAALYCGLLTSERAVVDSHVTIVRPNGAILAQYLHRLIQSPAVQSKIEDMQTGSTNQVELSRAEVLRTPVPLPPLGEQRRIVAKIDSLCGKSKRARDQFSHVSRLVEKYKQAILAAAFRGDLTREWRQAHPVARPIVGKNNIDQRVGELGDLPATRCWIAIRDVASVTGGLTKNAKRTLLPRRVPYLRVANVYAGELRLDDIAQIGCTDQELGKTLLQKGDLLIVEGNGSIDQIGRVALWNEELSGCSHQNHIIRGRPGPDLLPPYALYWLLSSEGRTAIEAVASSSSGLHTLSISKVEGLPIPICARNEQQEVVRKVEAALSWINRLATEATAARKLIDHLDQAILTKAFQGELVPQDPSDELASVLLERIRAEREAASTLHRRPNGEREASKPPIALKQRGRRKH